MFRTFFLLLAIAASVSAWAQPQTEYARQVIDTLCSETMFGRGYTKQGHTKAAEYLANEYKRLGLKPFRANYYQDFRFQINTFPNPIKLSIDGKELVAGRDFIAHAPSGSVNGTFPVVRVGKGSFAKKKNLKKLEHMDMAAHFMVADNAGVLEEEKEVFDIMPRNPLRAAGVLLVQDKLTATMAQEQYSYPVIEVLRSALPKKFETVTVEVESGLLPVTGRNVIGYVPGTEYPDSFLVVTAHYDHLGGMGDVYFPGANDNASGTAMLLALARHYAENPHKLSVVFFATAGEEVGLLGSRNFVDYPLFELDKIGFLLNFDILGTGDDGIKVVNGKVFTEHFERLVAINEENRWLEKVSPRGKAAISDHYFFTEKDVPCFYWYTLGGVAHYHDVHDQAATLPLTDFEDVFRLAVAFFGTF